jgi:hypothetical protein
MRKAMIMTVMLAALYLPQGGAAHSEAHNTDKFGALVCGEGNNALRSFADTTSPSGKFAFAWRSTQELPRAGRYHAQGRPARGADRVDAVGEGEMSARRRVRNQASR